MSLVKGVVFTDEMVAKIRHEVEVELRTLKALKNSNSKSKEGGK